MNPTKQTPGTGPWALTALMAGLLIAHTASAQTETVVDDGPIDPLYYFNDSQSILPGGSRASISWDLNPGSFETLHDGDVTTTSGSQAGDFYSFPVGMLPEVLASDPDLVRPTAMAENPATGDIWIADYGANRIMGFDVETGELFTVYDGSEANGTWGIGFMGSGATLHGFPYGGFSPSGSHRAVVSNRDNDTLMVLDSNGNRLHTYSDADINEPTGIGEAWTYDAASGRWIQSGGVAVANYGDNNILWYAGCDSWFCIGFYNPNTENMDGPIALVEARSYGGDSFFVLNQNGHSIANVPASVLPATTLVQGSLGLNTATGLLLMDPVPDPLNAHPRDVFSVAGSPTGGIYVADSGNDRVARAELNGLSLSDFLSGLDSPVDLHVSYENRDLYVLTSNESTGSASLIRYQNRYTAELERTGGDNDGYLAAVPGARMVDPTWIFNKSQGGESLSATVTRGDTWHLYLGWEDPASAEVVDLTSTLNPTVELPAPSIAVSGPSPGVLRAEVTLPVGTAADQIGIFMMTGCQELLAMSATRASGVYQPDYMGATGQSYPFPHPVRPTQLGLEHASECLRLVDFVPADPSGVTTVDFDDVSWVPDVEYCLVAQAMDSTGLALSGFSDTYAVASCERTPNANPNGLFCNQALEAAPYTEATGYPLMPLGDSGVPTWFDYTVSGDPGERRQVVFWVDDVDAADTLITIYDGCTATGGEEIAEGRQQLDIVASGGDQIKIRVAHFEVFPGVMRMLDLPSMGVTTPTNLSATSDLDEEVRICWSLDVSVEGLTMNPDLVSFEVTRGPSGQPADTLVAASRRQDCVLDLDLSANTTYDYFVTAKYALRVLSSQTVPVLLTSPVSAPVTGGTSGVVSSGGPIIVGVPQNLHVQLPYLVSERTVGTQLWWDPVPEASSYRVVQTEIASGTSEDFQIAGGARAADLPIGDLGLYCYDVYAQRPSGDTVIESSSVGYFESGDPAYCVNLCEDGVIEIDMRRVATVITEEFHGPVRYYELELGDFIGQIYTANYQGQPAEVCAWQGSASCDSLVSLGCAQPNLYGNSVLNLMITDNSQPIFVKWELLPLTSMTPAEQQTVSFPVEFGYGASVNTDTPKIAIDIVGTQCATQLTVDYLVTNWSAGLTGFISFVSDGNVVDSSTELSGTLDLPVDPTEGLHEVMIQLFDSPLEIAFSRRQLVPATRLRGDVDFNCAIDVLDAVNVINHLLGIYPFLEGVLPVADYTGDGLVDISDVVGLVNTILDAAASE